MIFDRDPDGSILIDLSRDRRTRYPILVWKNKSKLIPLFVLDFVSESQEVFLQKTIYQRPDYIQSRFPSLFNFLNTLFLYMQLIRKN